MTQHLDLDALQAAAEAATKGPWHSVHHGVSCGDDGRENICRVAGTLGKYENEKSNRDFISAANPAVVLALIDRLRKAEAETVPVAAFDRLSALNESNTARILELEAQAEAASKWQPIETAPKDGTKVLLLGKKGRIADGTWGQPDGWARPQCWVWPYINAEPTHWRPLPAAPTSADSEGEKG